MYFIFLQLWFAPVNPLRIAQKQFCLSTACFLVCVPTFLSVEHNDFHRDPLMERNKQYQHIELAAAQHVAWGLDVHCSQQLKLPSGRQQFNKDLSSIHGFYFSLGILNLLWFRTSQLPPTLARVSHRSSFVLVDGFFHRLQKQFINQLETGRKGHQPHWQLATQPHQ